MANPDILVAGTEAYVAALSAAEFDALVARTRDPEESTGLTGAARLADAFNKTNP